MIPFPKTHARIRAQTLTLHQYATHKHMGTRPRAGAWRLPVFTGAGEKRRMDKSNEKSKGKKDEREGGDL